jgi:hypothetical protein
MKFQCDKKADKRAHKISRQDFRWAGRRRALVWETVGEMEIHSLQWRSFIQVISSSRCAPRSPFSISVLDISLAFMHRGVAAAHLKFRFESRGTLLKYYTQRVELQDASDG